jgi:anti-anti-sigma regulatory factor
MTGRSRHGLHVVRESVVRESAAPELMTSGPVLDLSDVCAVDGDGMAPILEAEEVLSLRAASLRLASVSAAVAQSLDDARSARILGADRPPITACECGARRADVDPDRERD